MAIIIAVNSKYNSINVQANKAIPNSGAGYLAIPIQTRSISNYVYFAPGCNARGRSMLTLVSVYNYTCVSVDQFSEVIDEKEQRILSTTMMVRIAYNS